MGSVLSGALHFRRVPSSLLLSLGMRGNQALSLAWSTIASHPLWGLSGTFGTDGLRPPTALPLSTDDASDAAMGPSSDLVDRRVDPLEVPWILEGSKGGTPKKKNTAFYKRRVTHGIHFKTMWLKHEVWYYCPLCGEPKREREWCRREDCRQLKP